MKRIRKKLGLNRQSLAALGEVGGGAVRNDRSRVGCSNSCNTCQETCGLWDDSVGCDTPTYLACGVTETSCILCF